MENTTPAFRLLCACCRWPPSPEKLSAVEQAVSGVDWDEFRTLTDFHRAYGLVHSTLSSMPVALPAPLSDWLAHKARALARTGLLHLSETARLQRVFAEEGIDAVAVKGVSLGFHIYGSLALKHNRDIDIVVPPEFIGAALSIAQNNGYRLIDPATNLSAGQIAAFARFGKEFTLAKDGELLLEIHTRLLDNPGLIVENLLDHKGQDILCGGHQRIRTLVDADLFAYLCAHGAHHNWSRLKWLADVNALLARAGNVGTVAHFNARSEALGTKWCTALAQELCAELLGSPLPDAIKHLAATKRIQAAKRYCYRAMSLPVRGAEPEPVREFRDEMAQTKLGSGWRFWRGVLRSLAVKPSIILELNLPPRLIFLYPYLRLPFWLWFRWLNPSSRYRWSQKGVDTTT